MWVEDSLRAGTCLGGRRQEGAPQADSDLEAQQTHQSGCLRKLSFGFPVLAGEGSPSLLPTPLFHLAPKGLASKSPR